MVYSHIHLYKDMHNLKDNAAVKAKKGFGTTFPYRPLNRRTHCRPGRRSYRANPSSGDRPRNGEYSPRLLLEKGHDVHAVELDSESIDYLRSHLPELGKQAAQSRLLCLELRDPVPRKDSRFCLTGNYPYNISSQIFFRLLEYKDQIPLCTGMLQRSGTAVASKRTETYGILSVLLQAWYDVEYLFTVNEHASLPPKVKSGVIRLRRNSRTNLGCDEESSSK